ncbi:uncharacterized protein LOC133458263 [Cololabis saira]|uniref:uncharacterized protein LOC133458263 n=1 Tax=Cololabis saira TaxID=129043 RepID=UPI002AD3D497|nr:uncharacterized protein LOC133458263 [Cololabis saira]
MAKSQPPFLAAALLLVFFGLRGSSSSPACPQPCTCQRAQLLNCSSSSLSSVPQLSQDSFAELDLSNNLLGSATLRRPQYNLRSVWLGNNSITHLSLCVEGNLKGRYFRQRLRTRSRRGCLTWAPALQLLSVERNLLEQLPEGLDGVESLQILQLSFNKISTLQPQELSHLRQLKELHLKQNLITHLHPQMLQDLVQLRVLDLSFNMLTSLHPSAYLTLRSIGTDLRLNGNRWKCDCNMRSLRRRMAYDHSRGLQAWSMVCASPSILSGRDLLQLEEEDLKCLSAEKSVALHQDVTVYSGSEILLSCSAEDSLWWTSGGQASESQPNTDLLISDISERNTGLYVCVSGKQHIVSIFNLQISKLKSARNGRSLPRTRRQITSQDSPDRLAEEKNQRATSSDLALAVSLSVIFTFLIAFILGVLARPCFDGLWKRVTKKKTSSTTNSVSSVEQRQYDNEAFSSAEEPEDTINYRERRVTFSTVDIIEDRNINYYDTVASGERDSIKSDSENEYEPVMAKKDKHSAGDSGSENVLRQSNPEDVQSDDSDSSDGATRRRRDMEFENIPDPTEMEERSLSSCSDSSSTEKVLKDTKMSKGDQSITELPQLAEDSVQQRSDFSTAGNIVLLSHISSESKSEIPGFSSEPFENWSPHTNNRNPKSLNTSQDNEELFEFSDSTQSISPRSSSVISPFDNAKQIGAHTLDKQKRGDVSSSSSYISDDEPTQYTVNSDGETEQSERLQYENIDTVKPTVIINQVRDPSFSGSDSEEEITELKVRHNTGKKSQILNRFNVRSQTSSDESEDQEMDHMQNQRNTQTTRTQLLQSQSSRPDSSTQWPSVDLAYTKRNKRRLDIKAPPQTSASTSSSDTENETTDQTVKWRPGTQPLHGSTMKGHDSDGRWPPVDLQRTFHIKRRLDIKAPSPTSDSSAGSDGEYETISYIGGQRPGRLDIGRLPFQESKRERYDPDGRWPVVNLQHIPHIKRRLDIKASSPTADSSSSTDSEDETKGYIKKPEQKELHVSRVPVQGTQAVSRDPESQWPTVDLRQTMGIKRRLDIKAPLPTSDSSAGSDGEYETISHIGGQRPGRLDIGRLPVQESKRERYDPDGRWPVVNRQQIPHIKRRLDIKAPSPTSDSSAGSDGEYETISHIGGQRPGKLDIGQLPFQESKRERYDPDGRWPIVNLQHIPHIKRRLDIKAPSPTADSSASTDSEDETKGYIKKREQKELHVSRVPVQGTQAVSRDPESQWPTVDLRQTMGIKRRLDIKAPSPTSDSSAGSDGEYETISHIGGQRPGKLDIGRLPFQESKRERYDPDGRWPVVNLQHIPHIKRRLDIKAPSPTADSSASTDSEDETKGYIKKPEQKELHVSRVPVQGTQAVSRDPESQWPTVDLRQTMGIKRRLDIKAPLPTSDSSAGSDGEYETISHIGGQRPGKLDIGRLPFQESKRERYDPDGRWPVVNLQHIPHIKRRLDIKAPSPTADSSASTDSEDETKGYIKKQEQKELHVSRVPVQGTQAVSRDPKSQWPAVDLRQTIGIKRRLDIKAPSPTSDSSAGSDGEYETTSYIGGQRPGKLDIGRLPFQESKRERYDPDGRWPVVNLQHIPHIKRRLDIKAPSPTADSSASTDSEDETKGYIKKQEQKELHVSRVPVQGTQAVSRDPESQWPAVDLRQTIGIKRRLDIKAPSPTSDSSAGSDGEYETTSYIGGQRPGKLDIGRLPFQESKRERYDPDGRWPIVNLQHIPHIKRRLDIKAPSPTSDSLSSTDSEDETNGYIKKQEQKELHVSRVPVQGTQAVSRDPESHWPTVDLRQTIGIKRRLDIKAPSPTSDSSAGSDGEYETTSYIGGQRPGKLDIGRLPFQESKRERYDPDGRWPVVNLQHIPHIKRRLDIKAPSPTADSSASTDSEDETKGYIKKQEQKELHVSRVPVQGTQAVSRDPESQWPTVDLRQTMGIKRRLDIKAPSPTSDSSAGSDGEYETISHIGGQRPGKLDIGRLPFQESKRERYDPDGRWPVVNLQHIPHIKRRLDIKAPSPTADSSASTDSEDETKGYIKKQEQKELHVSRVPVQGTQAVSRDPESQWPTVDLRQTMGIKRRLDIKAPSPTSDSSAGSDGEYETISHIGGQRPGKLDIGRLPFQESKRERYDPDGRWPVVNLQHIPHIKRRLDIKAPSPTSDSLSSTDSEDETNGYIKKQEQKELHVSRVPVQGTQAVSRDPESHWPTVDLRQTMGIKRRLDIKAPSPTSDSSASSDGEYETTSHIGGQRPGKLDIGRLPFQESKRERYDPDGRWPIVNLQQIPHIKRRLDIKAPSPTADSSASTDSEDETKGYIEKQEQKELHVSRVPVQGTQAVSRDPKSQWPAVDLWQTKGFKRRLDIKAPSPDPDSSASTDGKIDTTNHIAGQQPGKLDIGQTNNINATVNQWPAVNLGNITKIKRRLDIKTSTPSWDSAFSVGNTSYRLKEKTAKVYNSTHRYSSSSSDYQEEGLKDYSKHHLTSEPDPNPSPELGLSSNIHIKRRLDIKAQSHSLKSSSSSDESDSGTTDITETMKGIQRGKIPHIKNRLDIKVPSQQPDMQLSKLPLDSHQSESHSSRSESEGENRGHKEKAGMGISTTSEKKFIRSPRAPMISVSHNPKKDPNIKLEKYGTISDESENKLTDDTVYTTEINPELQSRWATMNLGISRFRQRLEITSHTNEQPNVSQPPSTDSLHSLSTESRPGRIRLKRRVAGMQEIIHTDYSPVLENNPVNVFATIKNPNDKSDTSAEFTQKEAENYSLLTSKNESKSETVLVDFGDSQITKYPDFSEKAPSKPSQQPLYSSSRSISEDKRIDQYVLDLSLGVPRIKQRLNFKAPSPEPSSSSSCDSENENSLTGYQAKQSTLTTNVLEVADDSPILYKRSIIKTSSIPSYSFTPSDRSKTVDRTQEGVGDRDASLPSISFDTIVRRGIKQRHEIKQTDVGHHLPDLPISKATSVNVLTSLQQAPSAEPRSASRDSSSSVSFEIMQDHEKSATLLHKYSSLTSKSVTPSTSDIYDKLGSSPGRTFETSTVVSEDKSERRGLSALKDKSLEMRKWDSDLDKDAAPLFDDQHPQGGTQVDDSSYTADTEVLSEQQLPNPNLDSASANEKKILNLLYGIPQYRKHNFGHPKPPQ